MLSNPNVDRYFALFPLVEEAVSSDNFDLALRYVQEGVQLIPDFIEETCREYGRFDIVSSPIVERGCLLLAITGKREILGSLCATLTAADPEGPLAACAQFWIDVIPMIETILQRVSAEPGIHQLSLRSEIASSATRQFSEVCYWLARTARIRRTKSGRSFALFPADPIST